MRSTVHCDSRFEQTIVWIVGDWVSLERRPPRPWRGHKKVAMTLKSCRGGAELEVLYIDAYNNRQ